MTKQGRRKRQLFKLRNHSEFNEIDVDIQCDDRHEKHSVRSGGETDHTKNNLGFDDMNNSNLGSWEAFGSSEFVDVNAKNNLVSKQSNEKINQGSHGFDTSKNYLTEIQMQVEVADQW